MKRSKWKGPLIKSKQNRKELTLLPRNNQITSNLVGSSFSVYTGRKIVTLDLREEMIGHKVGEFIPTREKFEFKKKKKRK